MRPIRSEINLIYECPKCHAEHWARLEETVFPGGILCYCGEKLVLEPIADVEFKYNKKEEMSGGLWENAVDVLEAQGIKRNKAIELIVEVTKNTKPKTVGELVKECLKLL